MSTARDEAERIMEEMYSPDPAVADPDIWWETDCDMIEAALIAAERRGLERAAQYVETHDGPTLHILIDAMTKAIRALAGEEET